MADTAVRDKDNEPVHSHHEGHGANDSTALKRVQNVALTDALERQKPSLFTRRMFLVSLGPVYKHGYF
jgi:hypothetical protein